MLCKIVRKGGNGSLLWPDGCSSIEEVPYDLIRAIEHGFRVLDWHENLPRAEIPPEWMWTVDHELDQFFEEVERQRDEKYGASSSGDEMPEGGMMSNSYADGIRGK